MYNAGNRPFTINAKGAQAVSRENLNDLILYWNERKNGVKPEEAEKNLMHGANPPWTIYIHSEFDDILFKFTDAALSSQISKAPDMLRKDVKTVAVMTPKGVVASRA